MFNTYSYNKRLHGPLAAGCGLVEEDNNSDTNNSAQPIAAPSFPLDVFPGKILDIIVSLNEYENYNIDFMAASFFTVFAAAIGNTWSVRFMTGWVSRPIIYGVGRIAELRQDSAVATGSHAIAQTRWRI